ncbi:MAG: hypothetical protein ACI4XL_09895 [Bacillus sp. (in: firmicutes)]
MTFRDSPFFQFFSKIYGKRIQKTAFFDKMKLPTNTISNGRFFYTNYTTEQVELPLSIQEETPNSPNKYAKPTFIPYDNHQATMIFDIQELIPEQHVSRVIDQMIEEFDDEVFLQHYQRGGRSSYHSKMMAKVVLYAYSQKIYSC